MPYESLQMPLDLNLYLNLKFGWRHSLEPSPPFKNETLAIAVKK